MRIYLIRDDRIALPDGSSYAVAKPINDLLALRDDPRYLAWLEAEWEELAPSQVDVARMMSPRRKAEPESHAPADLAEIAVVAAGGTEQFGDAAHTINYARLAPLLSRVKYFMPEVAGTLELEVPSLAVLAAWALVREIERGDWLMQCTSCQQLFFTRVPVGKRLAAAATPEWYCHRPAPGLTISCAQVHAHERFAQERKAWSREYRKVMARKLRGAVSERDFRAWKAISRPGQSGKDWIPFDEWREKNDG